MQKAVDGADVQGAVAPQKHIYGLAGTGGRPEFFFRCPAAGRSRSQRVILEPREQAFAHLGRGFVGEGDGQYLLPAVVAAGVGRRQGAACGSLLPRSGRSACHEGKEGAGERVGLAGTGGGFDLAELIHISEG